MRSNKELWRGVEERKRLNAAFSHDLRTPLTVLKGHASMLLCGLTEDGMSREEAAEEVRAMTGSIARLERYVEAMASLQRLEDVEVHREAVSFGELARGLRDSAQILCAGKALKFQAIPGRSVRVDGEIVAQVFENILVNGARYARSALEVRLWTEANRLMLRVRDDGPGFSPADLEKATEPFYRDKSTPDGGCPLGLGLNICKILCRRHGGDIRLENDGGASVTATFEG